MNNLITKDVQKGRGFFETAIEIVGWVQIFASPFLITFILGSLIYFPQPTTIRLIIGILVLSAGTVLGIIWATKAWKKKGTMHFISRVSATPELDPPDEVKL